MQWQGPLFRSRTAEERRTPRSLLRLTAAISAGVSVSDNSFYPSYSPPRRTNDSPARKLAFDDAASPAARKLRASDDSFVAPASNGNSPVSVDGTPRPGSAVGWSHARGNAVSPTSTRATPVAVRHVVDASTCLTDAKTALNQLVDVCAIETQVRDKLVKDEAFGARVLHRHHDELTALRAAERAAEHRRLEAESKPKSSLHYPHPYPDPTGLTPAKQLQPESVHADQFLDPQFHLRWDLELYEQSMRRRVCVRERLDRDVVAEAHRLGLDVDAMRRLEAELRNAACSLEGEERLSLALRNVEGLESVIRLFTVVRTEGGAFDALIAARDRSLDRDATARAHRAGAQAIAQQRHEAFEEFGRDLFEPHFLQLRHVESQYRAMTEREENNDRYFAVSKLAVTECEVLSRSQDVEAPERAERSALAQSEGHARAEASTVGTEARERAILLSKLSEERNRIVNDHFAALQRQSIQNEATRREAMATDETTQVSVLKRGVHLLNMQAPVAQLFATCSNALMSLRFRCWARWQQAKKKQRMLLQQRLRRLTALNSKMLPRRYLDIWRRWLVRRQKVATLLRASEMALRRSRFASLRGLKQFRIVAAHRNTLVSEEADARRAVELSEASARQACDQSRQQRGPFMQCVEDEARARRSLAALAAKEFAASIEQPHRLALAARTICDEDVERLLIETREDCEVALLGRAGLVVRALPIVDRLAQGCQLVVRNAYFAKWMSMLRARRRMKQVRLGKVNRLAVSNQRLVLRRYYALFRRFATVRKRVALLLRNSSTALLGQRFKSLMAFTKVAANRRAALRDETVAAETHARRTISDHAGQQWIVLSESHGRAVVAHQAELEFRNFAKASLQRRATELQASEADERDTFVREEALEFRGFVRQGKQLRIAMRYETKQSVPLEAIRTDAEIALAQRAMSAWRRFFSRRIQMYRQHISSMPGIAAMLAASMLED